MVSNLVCTDSKSIVAAGLCEVTKESVNLPLSSSKNIYNYSEEDLRTLMELLQSSQSREIY